MKFLEVQVADVSLYEFHGMKDERQIKDDGTALVSADHIIRVYPVWDDAGVWRYCRIALPDGESVCTPVSLEPIIVAIEDCRTVVPVKEVLGGVDAPSNM